VEERWYLYILKYKATGSYYVGAASSLGEKKNDELVKTSCSPLASSSLVLKKGFYSFKYKLNGIEDTKDNTMIVVNRLTCYLRKWAANDVIVNGGVFMPTNIEKTIIKEAVNNNEEFLLSASDKFFFEEELIVDFKCQRVGKEVTLTILSPCSFVDLEGVYE